MSTYHSGDTAIFYALGAPADLVGTLTIELRNAVTGDVILAETSAGCVEQPSGLTSDYVFTVTLPDANDGEYRAYYDAHDGSDEVTDDETFTIANAPAGALDFLDAILDKGGSQSDYTDDLKQQAVMVALSALEREAGVAFSPRTLTETISGAGETSVFVKWPKVTNVASVTMDGVAVDVADVRWRPHGRLTLPSTWTDGQDNISVTYTHGYDPSPDDALRAVALLASSLLADGPYDDRGYGITDEGGAIRLLTAGVQGAAFSIPEVQACLKRYRIAPVIG